MIETKETAMDIATRLGWLVILEKTGAAMPDPETDGTPAIFGTESAAAAAARVFADDMYSRFDIDVDTRVIPAVDYIAPAVEVPEFAYDADLLVGELAFTDPVPDVQRVTYLHAVLLAGGSLYCDEDSEALGRKYTTYGTAEEAGEVAERLTGEARDSGLSGYTATVVSRAVMTVVEDWEIHRG